MLTRIVPLGLLILFLGCSFDAENRRKSWSAGVVSRSKEDAPRPAPATIGPDVDGKAINLADHEGKVVLLSFWHSQCPPCRALFAHENHLVAKHSPSVFSLIGVNADPDAARLRTTLEKAKLTYPSIADGASGPVCAAWKIEAFPTLVLIDQSGRIRWRHVGMPNQGELDGRIQKLIEETQLTSK